MTAPTVLVVEDNPLTRKMLRLTLESEGYQVIEAADGRAALAAVEQEPPALVLQDLILPDVNGMELVRQLRATVGDELPIIALSGFVNRIEDARSADAGFSRVVLKPVEPSQLLETIRPYLPSPEPVAPSGRGFRVLLVDDDTHYLELARARLARYGFHIEIAVDAESALAAARRRAPHAILCNVLGAGLDGHQLCLDVREDSALAHVPVVLMSSWHETPEDRRVAERVGAAGWVAKTHDLKDVPGALLRSKRQGAPALYGPLTTELRLEHARTTIRQLQRQLQMSNVLSRRCTLQAAQISLLGGLADALVLDHDPDRALRDVLAATLDLGGISKGALYLRREQGELSLVHALGFSPPEVDALDSIFDRFKALGDGISRQSTLAIPSPAFPDGEAGDILSILHAESVQVVPLVSDGRGVGAILLCATNSDINNDDSIAFARAIGNQLAQSLELARYFAQLTASERRYRAVTEAAHDAISLLGADGVIRDVNPSFEATLGLTRAQLVGRRIHDLAEPRSDVVGNGGVSFFPKDALAQAPVALRKADGSVVLMEFTSRPVELEGELLFVSIGRDVSERVKTHAHLMMSDRMASIGALAAGVAHEINNPLMATTANLDMALDQLEATSGAAPARGGSELRELLTDARDAADRVRVIVRDLKLFSRAEADQREPVSVERVLESSVRMAWNEIRHRAQLVREYSPVPPVEGNEARLGQVFLNLIVNAAQALPDGFANQNSIVIRTSLNAEGLVTVDVEDTGPGIPADVLPHLFTPFFTTKPRGVGTGLGLTICQRIVTSHGGRILVDSVVGRGTRFSVTLLPAQRADVQASVRPSADRAPRRGRLLVVDDDDMSARAISRALSGEHDVTTESDADAALDRLGRGEPYDVILCDMMMPVKTGVEFFADLSRLMPGYVDRVVFLTGGAFTAKAHEFVAGMEGRCLDKPIDIASLRSVVNGML